MPLPNTEGFKNFSRLGINLSLVVITVFTFMKFWTWKEEWWEAGGNWGLWMLGCTCLALVGIALSVQLPVMLLCVSLAVSDSCLAAYIIIFN